MNLKSCVAKSRHQALLFAVSAAFATSALAAVSAEEAKQLGGAVLTEWGAERAGNKDGTITAWTGEYGKIKVPASYDPKDPGQNPDPFGDKPLYSITAQNMDKYADKLTEGMKALFKLYPNYRMDIYPTRRTVAYPKYVLENSIKNATSCKGTDGGLKLEGCWAGVPFPMPKNGHEAVWNHLVTYQAPAFGGNIRSWIVDANGKPQQQSEINLHYKFPYWFEGQKTTASPRSNYWMLRFDYNGPARRVGEKYVIIYALDPIDPGQRAYVYVPGQRRVKLAPDLSYDTPSPVSGGADTMDENGGFLGAQDRYNMKLIGKKETYLIVNSNALTDYKACPQEKMLTKNFTNPDCVRWELRRTWQVEGTLKPGFRHIIPRRMMYFDEDGGGATVADMYDASGKLFRVDTAPEMLRYSADGTTWIDQQGSTTFDLITGIHAFSTANDFPGAGLHLEAPKPDLFFSPEALAGEGIR